MATGINLRTYFNGEWHEGDVPVMRAADHGSWLGTTVFDGARYVNGLAPDLDRHLARVNRSAEALMLNPGVNSDGSAGCLDDAHHHAVPPSGARGFGLQC